MFDTFLYSILDVSVIFGLSTLTAYSICKIFNVPVINPTYSPVEIQKKAYEMCTTIPILLVQSSAGLSIFYNSIESKNTHNTMQTIGTLFMYSMITEGVYYMYHYSVHKYAYTPIHKKHHTNTYVYPFDTYYFTLVDDVFLTISLEIPMIFLNITYFEHFFISWLYITSSFLVHSNYISKIHYNHHIYHTCNYCILFPVYDVLFGTYRILDRGDRGHYE